MTALALSTVNPMTSGRGAALLAFVAGIAALGGALLSQYVGGLQPCALCIWQRWPWGIVIVLSLAALLVSGRARTALVALTGLTVLGGAGVALFHVGVEQGWWTGLESCGATTGGAATLDELRAQILAAPVVRCTDVAWEMFGVSMAGYNFLISLAVALTLLEGARRQWFEARL